VIQRKNLRNLVPVLCALRKWLWNAGRWAGVSMKVNSQIILREKNYKKEETK
jgi:hypothetical protein